MPMDDRRASIRARREQAAALRQQRIQNQGGEAAIQQRRREESEQRKQALPSVLQSAVTERQRQTDIRNSDAQALQNRERYAQALSGGGTYVGADGSRYTGGAVSGGVVTDFSGNILFNESNPSSVGHNINDVPQWELYGFTNEASYNTKRAWDNARVQAARHGYDDVPMLDRDAADAMVHRYGYDEQMPGANTDRFFQMITQGVDAESGQVGAAPMTGSQASGIGGTLEAGIDTSDRGVTREAEIEPTSFEAAIQGVIDQYFTNNNTPPEHQDEILAFIRSLTGGG